MIDWLMLVLYILGVILLISGVAVIILYFRFWEQKKRLPEACAYLDLKQKTDALRQENAELEKARIELPILNEEVKAKRQWLEKNEQYLLSLSADRKKQEEIKVEYESYLDKLSILLQQLQDKNREIATLKSEHIVLSAQVDEKKTTINSLTTSCSDLKKQAEDLKSDNNTLVSNVDKMRDLMQNLVKQKKQQEDAFLEIQKDHKSLETQLRLMETTMGDYKKRNQNLLDDISQLRTEKRQLEADNAAIQKENETWRVENESALRHFRELQDRVGAEQDKLDNITAEYHFKHSEIEAFETQKKALQDEIETLKNASQNIQSNLSQITGKASPTDALKDLWEPIAFPSLLPSAKERSEIDLLEDTQNYIRGKKLYFPRRVIHAFHTSMKCNDISPLTVLAGISGTGKSELPKCYAEGMGIHFTMLAVQPRWDSPQDLLGFYNYMENKYKPTELARAMVRFDMFNREQWGEIPPECDDRSDRMLLVLLDEMNLARVEYYFSEFLSKLETRRGVNIYDDMDRVKSEIELELTGRAPLRIFPGRNILFTGTMNEDESTQTLSDKVLDRANILRFGKPKSSDISAQIRNSTLRPPREEGMTYARWNTWCTEAKGIKVDRTISEWIDELNCIMAELQKPFGHRVAQAIAAYVVNYPKGIAHGKEQEMAFADQIEQRIMPKLRGIDLIQNEDALNKIGKLIARTNDEALADAFERGCKDDANGVFMWQGVDRSEDL